jgi:tight adherence protein B
MSPTLLLVVAAVAGLALLGYGLLAGPAPAKAGLRRLEAVRLRHSDNTSVRVEGQLRKALAARRPTMHRLAGSGSQIDALALRLERTGLPIGVRHYLVASAALVLAIFSLVYLNSGAALLATGIAILVGAGLPHMVVGKLLKRRLAAFNARFPDAIELLVRGLRSGLPVSETLGIVAREVPGPVGAEFRAVVERIRIGRTMEDALQVTADKLGTAEFQFFVITLAIQRETGGNLAETLSNLADVLRKRAQMKLKIRALSSESKASAVIVGALPFVVFGLLWWINPEYLAGFAEDERLIVTGLGGMIWMLVGVFIMSRMVSFEI